MLSEIKNVELFLTFSSAVLPVFVSKQNCFKPKSKAFDATIFISLFSSLVIIILFCFNFVSDSISLKRDIMVWLHINNIFYRPVQRPNIIKCFCRFWFVLIPYKRIKIEGCTIKKSIICNAPKIVERKLTFNVVLSFLFSKICLFYRVTR